MNFAGEPASPAATGLTEPRSPKPLPRSQRLALAITRWLPNRLAEECLAFTTLAQGIASRRRRRNALAWAASQPTSRRSSRSLACSMLAFRGRYAASLNQFGVPDWATLRGRVTIEGRHHLDAASRIGGVLLLGFHLGPLMVPVALRSHGYRLTLGRWSLQRVGDGKLPWWIHPPEDLVLFAKPEWRVRALYELRRRLNAGRMVYLAGDGLNGMEAFRIELPGAPLVLRTGWLTLRRCTRATTLPVLSRREGRRIVVTIHPPLPDPVASPETDIAACRAYLTPLVEDYVRRFPEQCFWLALQPPPD